MEAQAEEEAAVPDMLKGQKVDYKPTKKCDGSKNDKEWVEAHLTQVVEDGGSLKLDIGYKYCDTDKEDKEVIFPTDRVAKCAEKLITRTNCTGMVKSR